MAQAWGPSIALPAATAYTTNELRCHPHLLSERRELVRRR